MEICRPWRRGGEEKTMESFRKFLKYGDESWRQRSAETLPLELSRCDLFMVNGRIAFPSLNSIDKNPISFSRRFFHIPCRHFR